MLFLISSNIFSNYFYPVIVKSKLAFRSQNNLRGKRNCLKLFTLKTKNNNYIQ